ncbi:MAG: hypothetical protein JXB38_18845 [Anaerolineales bacterium]|nr:hypothetical protein [Anaerolineales bacterium]
MKKHYIRFAPILLLGLASLACAVAVDLENTPDAKTITVEAKEGWTDTQITVEAGDHLTITYISGKWSPWGGGEYDAIGSGGDPLCRCNVVMGVSHAALIGRIGDNAPFLVGTEYQHTIGESGTLYLGINDVDIDDNSGSLRVLVEVGGE